MKRTWTIIPRRRLRTRVTAGARARQPVWGRATPQSEHRDSGVFAPGAGWLLRHDQLADRGL